MFQCFKHKPIDDCATRNERGRKTIEFATNKWILLTQTIILMLPVHFKANEIYGRGGKKKLPKIWITIYMIEADERWWVQQKSEIRYLFGCKNSKYHPIVGFKVLSLSIFHYLFTGNCDALSKKRFFKCTMTTCVHADKKYKTEIETAEYLQFTIKVRKNTWVLFANADPFARINHVNKFKHLR